MYFNKNNIEFETLEEIIIWAYHNLESSLFLSEAEEDSIALFSNHKETIKVTNHLSGITLDFYHISSFNTFELNHKNFIKSWTHLSNEEIFNCVIIEEPIYIEENTYVNNQPTPIYNQPEVLLNNTYYIQY